tara:strand:+ start:5105 stop:6325 length:1221 start_codon:yes stop_codon:yes gene_type:complete
MAFGEDFLKGFFGNDYLKDYTHASKTFRSNSYALAPRRKFLYHVVFNLNIQQIPQLRNVFQTQDLSNLSLLVKEVKLPSYKFNVETMNQYNRKRKVQTQIDYDPIVCTMHDDASDLSRTLWYNYYAYYYKDASQKYYDAAVTNGSMGQNAQGVDPGAAYPYNFRDIYTQDREINDWGYIGESYTDGTRSGKPAFFRDITIFGFDQHKWAAYTLINPIISSFEHDTYNYAEGAGIMQNSFTFEYETVKYYNGALTGSEPDGGIPTFANPGNYDTVKSPLSRPGSTSTIFGQAGLIDAASGIMTDLSAGNLAGVVGAIQKGGTAYQTFKGADLASIIKTESTAILTNTIKSQLPGMTRGVLFPNQPVQPSAVTSVNNPSTLKPAVAQTSGGPKTISTQTNTRFNTGLY